MAPNPGIAQLYVGLAQRMAARLGSPRVRAVHLPRVEAASGKDAEFLAVELDDGSVGLSYVLDHASLRIDGDVGAFVGKEALALACGYGGRDGLGKALGFATINALSQQLFSRAGWTPPSAGDSLGEIDPKRGEHIGMIGLFHPLVERVSEAGARLTVLELKPELAGEREHFRVTLDPAELASCCKVISTCAVMLNDTVDAVLAGCRNAHPFAIVGPTAGCVPDPLFERGVDAIGGRRVIDTQGFLDAFGRGEKWGAFARKYVIARQDYPGIEWLLERVS